MASKSEREERRKQFQSDYIERTTVKAIWSHNTDIRADRSLTLYLPFQNWLKSNLFFDNVDEPYVQLGKLEVNKEMRGRGIGERLYRALGVAATNLGQDWLYVWAQAPYAVKMAEKIYGEDSLQLGPVVSEDGEEGDPPKDLDHAKYLLEKRQNILLRHWSEVEGIHLWVDLENVDFRGWEMPVLPKGSAPAPFPRRQIVQ